MASRDGKGKDYRLLKGKEHLLIVFTDEVGSTIKDENEFAGLCAEFDVLEKFEEMIREYQKRLTKRRSEQFSPFVQVTEGHKAKIIKNVGDSLIITRITRLEAGDELIAFIRALYEIWSRLNTPENPILRVAVHIAPLPLVATDQALNEFSGELLTLVKQFTDTSGVEIDENKLLELWPALYLMSHDVFGAPMNRAARLASIPPGAQFIISEEVAVACVAEKYGIATELIHTDSGMDGREGRHPAEWHRALREGVTLLRSQLSSEVVEANLIPVVNVKSLNRVTVSHPWWVVEFKRLGSEAAGPVEGKGDLLSQSKTVQTIRIVEIAGNVITDGDRDQATDRINSFVSKAPPESAIPFFIDAVFEIAGAWNFLEPRRDRVIPNRQSVKFRRAGEESMNERRPVCMVFGSAPDIGTDAKVREKFREIRNKAKWVAAPVTLRVHGASMYVDAHESLKPGLFYFLEFLIPRGPIPPDSPRIFSNIKRNYDVLSRGKLTPVVYGLLEGDTDGFVLFRAEDEVDATVVQEWLEKLQPPDGTEPATFIKRVAPAMLYRLKLLYSTQDDAVWETLTALGDSA